MTLRTTAIADALLDRHGVVTRTMVAAENVPGGFAGVYRVLAAMEERGATRRGYFIDGLGAAQFALPGAVDQLRALSGDNSGPAQVLVLAATDPANPYGAALPWPERVPDAVDSAAPGEHAGSTGGHRPGRRAGALVVLAAGSIALYVERGGRTWLSYTSDPQTLTAAALALADAVRTGTLDRCP